MSCFWFLIFSIQTPASDPLAHRIPQAQVLEDLTTFQRIHETANAGLYKYRTKAQMDSAFAAARAQVTGAMKVLDVYKLLVDVTDFEGSTHNETLLPDSVERALNQQVGFFPYPVKWVGSKLLLDYEASDGLPIGTEIVSVNKQPVAVLMQRLGRYYTTDGFNQTGKQFGVPGKFAKLFYYEYGPQASFEVATRPPGNASGLTQTQQVAAVNFSTVRTYRRHRHSALFDSLLALDDKRPYRFQVRGSVGVLTVRSFAIGNGRSTGHHSYRQFLDSCFTHVRDNPAIRSVVVDVRDNGGGTDPNDMVTFTYLAQQPFRENTKAFVLFSKIPYPQYLRSEGQGSLSKRENREALRDLRDELQGEYAPVSPDGHYYQLAKIDSVYRPNALRTTKPVCLLVDSEIASAASMFCALVRGRTSAVVVGQETSGGYYGHTGHTPVRYLLPHTGIITCFSLVDLEQDVPVRADQPFGRGIIPDYPVSQTEADFLASRDTQLEFALRLMTERTANKTNR